MADDFFGQRYKTQRSNADVTQDLEALSAALKSTSDEKSDPFADTMGGTSAPALDDAVSGFTIHDLLNGYVVDEDTLSSIDECLIHILSEWDLSDILSKESTDCQRLLSDKCKHAPLQITSVTIDPPNVLYDTLLRIARKIKAISLVIGNQKMIYVPENIEEMQVISNQLMGLNAFLTIRSNHTGHTFVASADDPDPSDPDKDDAKDFLDSGSGASTRGDLESLIFGDRELYRDTVICQNREKEYLENRSGILNLLKKDQKSNSHTKAVEEHIANNKQTETNPNDTDEQTETNPNNTDEQKQEVQELQPMDSSKEVNVKKAHPNDICCAGCGNLINISHDYDRLIIYRVPIKPDELFYFHDTFCVTLRRLKESIRRYVMDQSLPEARRADTTIGYIRNLLMNFNTLITTRGVVPRPNPLIRKSKLSFLSNKEQQNEQIIMMQFVRSSAHKLILRQQAIEARDVNPFDDEYSWKFGGIPQSIQYADMVIYGPCLSEYVIQQLLSKQLDSLWLTLAFVVSGMTASTSLQIIEEHRTSLAKVQDMEYLDIMLISMIEASDYTIAMSLYLSAYVMENAEQDLSRSDDFENLASKYVRIASELVRHVESDHLLSLLLETPTDIAHLSTFEIAIKYGIDDFMDDSRIQMLMVHMWSEFDFLDPGNNFRTQDIDLVELISLLAKDPARFYYCPVGRYWTWSVMYMVYICVVSTVVYTANYELTSVLTPPELVMWIFNIGFVMAEITQMAFEGVAYLTDVGNYFDILIIIIWAILALLRFGCKSVFANHDGCYASNNNGIADGNTRNKPVVLVYMALFCAQICILWSRVCLIFATSRNVGPFISMIPGMVRDILKWTFVLGIFYIGYSFGVHFIIAGDISDECQSDGSMDSFSVVAEYNFILLMGQSEWSILEANDCMSSGRSLLLKLYMYGFSILGTVLLLNLLIAMMASTYEQIREGTAKQVNFARAEQTFGLAHRDAIIPPPLNVLVFAFSLVWFALEFLVWLCCGGRAMLNIENLVPVRVDYASGFERYTYKNARSQGIVRCRGLCQRIRDPKGLTTKMTSHYSETARYCQYCRCYMRINGNISDYFKLFINYRLDEADVKFMKSLMQSAGICPQCYRPYRIYEVTESGFKSNRLYRWQVILELLSFYVFMLVIYTPLIILVSLPALFGGIVNRFDDMTSATKLVEGDRQIIKDDKYVQLVENIIEKEGTTDTEVLSTQVAQLNRKLIQIKMNQQASGNVLAEQSMDLEKHSQILTGIVPYIRGIDVKMDKSMFTSKELHEKQMERFQSGMQEQTGVLSTHTDYNKQHQEQLEQQMLVAQQHRSEMEIFKQELGELKVLREEDDKMKKEQAQRQQALEEQHAQEIRGFGKELKQQRVLREMEATKLAKQSTQQTAQLQKVHSEQLQTLQGQIERQKFLRSIEEQKMIEEQEKRELLTLKQQQDMAILNAQMEQMRLLKEAENKKREIELKLRRKHDKKMKDVEKEILRIKQKKKRQKTQRDSLAVQHTKRMEQLQTQLLNMKSEQDRKDEADKRKTEIVEIKEIEHQSKVQELKEQMDRLVREQEVMQNESVVAQWSEEKGKMKHQIQLEKIKQSMTRLQLDIPEDDHDEDEEKKEDEQEMMMIEDDDDEDDEYDEEDRVP